MSDPLLRDLTVYDTEGTRWAVVQRWLKEIAELIYAQGGGGGDFAGHDAATATIAGSVALNSTYGFFQASSPTAISRIQISAQTAPVGSNLVITLVDGSGVSLGVTATLNDGLEYQQTVIDPPLALAAADIVRLKVTSVGSTTPGGYLTVNLISPYATGRDVSTMTVVGTAGLNQTYGFLKTRTTTTIDRVQIACQTAPVGADLTVTFVDQFGSSLGITGKVTDGAFYEETVFPSPATFPTGSIIRAKVTGVGSTTPGGYLNINLISPNSTGGDIVTFTIVGSAVLNQTHGFYLSGTPTTISRVQIACQTAPVGSNLTITLVDGGGTSLGIVATVAAGSEYQETQLTFPVTVPAGTTIRAKVTGVGSTTPGGYLVINLL